MSIYQPQTKLHRAFDTVKKKAACDLNVGFLDDPRSKLLYDKMILGGAVVNDVELLVTLGKSMTYPNFYLDHDLIDSIKMEDAWDCIKAMEKMGRMRLPFRHQIVEFDEFREGDQKVTRVFILFEDTSDRPLFPGEKFLHPFKCTMWRLKTETGRDRVCLSPQLTYILYETEGGKVLTDSISHMTNYIKVKGFDKETMDAIHGVSKWEVKRMAQILSVLILLLNTRGVKKDVIEPSSKLNKIRVKSGKPSIPTQTVLRIGSYYDRGGSAHTVDADGNGKDRKPVRVHWRKGHIRSQRYGAGLQKVKEVFIEPCLVNWSGDDEEWVEPYRAKVQR